jgi:hypothetical protein
MQTDAKVGKDNSEHFSATIIVNAQQKTVTKRELSYDDVIELAFGPNAPRGPDIVYSVAYRKGEQPKHEGTLVAGQSVKVKDGMVFDVTQTNRS